MGCERLGEAGGPADAVAVEAGEEVEAGPGRVRADEGAAVLGEGHGAGPAVGDLDRCTGWGEGAEEGVEGGGGENVAAGAPELGVPSKYMTVQAVTVEPDAFEVAKIISEELILMGQSAAGTLYVAANISCSSRPFSAISPSSVVTSLVIRLNDSASSPS